MSVPSSDLQQFHQFIAQQLARGDTTLTPEDCLDAWRADHPSAAEFVDTLAAIENGLAQARRGEGIPIDEFVQRFRDGLIA